MDNKKICSTCGKALPYSAIFCDECGQKQPEKTVSLELSLNHEKNQETVSETNTNSDALIEEKIDTKKCLRCGTELPVDANFCKECAAQQNLAVSIQSKKSEVKSTPSGGKIFIPNKK